MMFLRGGCSFWLLLLATSGLLQDTFGEPVVAKCPPADAQDTSNEFCKCEQNLSRNGRVITIKCKFNDKEDVLLTEALYPFRNQTLITAYVRVENASSVRVTESFLREWQQALSIALDIWRGGNITFDATPEHQDLEKFANYKTFVGVGIVKCNVPEIPEKFLRDRARGGFRVKGSRVGVLRAGFMHKIEEMRYLVLEDTIVDRVEGPVATEGFVTLSKRQLHSWTGLVLANVTINDIAPNAFNLTHRSDMETVMIANNQLGIVGTGAFTVAGDITVSITGNTFQHLKEKAFQIAVTGDVKFDDNVIESWASDGLQGLVCHERTTLERNTLHVKKYQKGNLNAATAPFHDSCGSPQLFMVVSPSSHSASAATVATWLIGILLLVLVVALVAGVVYTWKTQGLVLRYYTGRGAPMYLNGRKASQENLSFNAEGVSVTSDAQEVGVSNPMYSTTTQS